MKTKTILLLVLAALLISPAPAGDGVVTITIDRGAVSGLVRAGLPRINQITVPALGEIRLMLIPPDEVQFQGGAIVARIGYYLAPSGLEGTLITKYAPVANKDGSISLKAKSVVPEGKYAVPVDLAGFLPEVQLPEQFRWITGDINTQAVDLTAGIEAIEVQPEQLVIRLDLTSKTFKKAASNP
jgi:hypothetical protein